MSEIQTDETQPSDFARALNSMMDNLENVVVNFQKTLLVMLEKIEKLESLEKFSKVDTTPNEKEPNTEEIKQLTNDTTTSKMLHQELSETHNKTEMTTNTGTKRSIFTGTFNKIIKKVSSKSNYLMLAVAIAILGIVIFKLYFMLFP